MDANGRVVGTEYRCVILIAMLSGFFVQNDPDQSSTAKDQVPIPYYLRWTAVGYSKLVPPTTQTVSIV